MLSVGTGMENGFRDCAKNYTIHSTAARSLLRVIGHEPLRAETRIAEAVFCVAAYVDHRHCCSGDLCTRIDQPIQRKLGNLTTGSSPSDSEDSLRNMRSQQERVRDRKNRRRVDHDEIVAK